MAEGLEKKLAALTALNGVLKSENEALRRAAAAGGGGGGGGGGGVRGGEGSRREVEELTREFTERLAQVEDRMLAVADERDALRAQAQMDGGRVGRLESRATDAEARAEELRSEVQALSRGKGELDGECRRLRAQLRDSEAALAALRDKAQGMETDARAARDLEESGARDALGRVAALEAELQVEREGRDKRVESAVSAAERRTAEEYRVRIDGLTARAGALEEQLSGALADAAARERDATLREDALREEVSRLETKSRAAEAEREGAQLQASEAAEPLMRQLEDARRSGEAAVAQSARVEAALRKELEGARADLRDAQREVRQLGGRAEAAEGAASRAREGADDAERQLRDLRSRCDRDSKAAREAQMQVQEANERLQDVARALEDKLAQRERDLRDGERVVAGLEGKLAEATRERSEAQGALARLNREGGGPQRSEGRAAGGHKIPTPESEGGLLGGKLDDLLKAFPSTGGGGSSVTAVTLAGPTPSGRAVEMLRQQVDSLKRDRDRAQSEVSSALERAQAAETAAREANSMKDQIAELQGQQTAAFLLIGERNERVAQLEDDLAEVKRIFRDQVAVMVEQINAAKGEAQQLRIAAADGR